MQPGDQVKVKTKAETYEGMLMPRPELLDSGYIILKLENGYNLGIEKKKILDINVLRKHSKAKAKHEKIKQSKALPKVSVLSFGGTISSKIDYSTGGVTADYTAEDFLKMMPKLRNIANIKARKVMGKMSEDFLPEDWRKMAQEAAKELKISDAVVLTQGTDTLHYSTAILSFFMRNLKKPVIFTGAQRSIDRGSSDAFQNMECAIKAAVNFDGVGIFLVMHGSSSDDFCYIHKGTKVRKMHSLRRDAFRSINELPLAKVFPNSDEIQFLNNDYHKKGEIKEKFCLDTGFEERVALIYVYPGLDPKILDFYIDNGYKGIVLAATALGHVSVGGKKNIMKQLARANKKKIALVVATQCFYGRVDPLVYGNLRKLSLGKDVIFAEDMLPEVAYLKLGWILSKTKKLKEVKKLMLENVAGEINYKQDSRAFLN